MSTNNNYTPSCNFCVALARYANFGMTTDYIRISGDTIRNRELLVTDQFRVIVALSPLIEGNLMILPIDHFTSMAAVGIRRMQELGDLKSRLRDVLSRLYDEPIFFEHGLIPKPGYVPPSDASVEHAHLHVLPKPLDLLALLQEHHSGFRLNSYESLASINFKEAEYLHYETHSGENWVFPADHVEHQLIRKLASAALGQQNEWDWHSIPKVELMHRTMDVLEPAFKSEL